MFGRLKHLAGVETRAQTISPGLIGRTYTVYIALPLPLRIALRCQPTFTKVVSGFDLNAQSTSSGLTVATARG